jgi:Tol biopolymer transport system component
VESVRAGRSVLVLALALAAGGCAKETQEARAPREIPPAGDTLRAPGEAHLANLRQLTFGGENAEAYFSPDGTELVFQSTRPPFACDQIFRMPVAGGDPELVSTGLGRTTCAYFMPDTASVLYASTHLGSEDCPPRPDYSSGYVWPVYPDFDIFVRDAARDTLIRLTEHPGYDAEATVSPRGDRIVFTSMRSGDLDLYSMNLDGTGVLRLTREPGYDGGAFFSPDGTEIVYRAHHPSTAAEQRDYRDLLDRNLIRPGTLNLYVMNADGGGRRLVLENGAANFAPYFFPDGERIIFSSNLHDPEGRNFDLYMIHKDGTGLERITYNETFDGFPMFSPDGRHLVFASNRNNRAPRDTNVFLAEWVE